MILSASRIAHPLPRPPRVVSYLNSDAAANVLDHGVQLHQVSPHRPHDGLCGQRPLTDAHCEAWRPNYTHRVLISDSLIQCTKDLARPVHFSNAWAAILGMGECKSPPTTVVKLLRLSSVKSALTASGRGGMTMFSHVCVEFNSSPYHPTLFIVGHLRQGYLAIRSVHLRSRYVNAVIRDSHGSENIRRRRLQPLPQVQRRKVWLARSLLVRLRVWRFLTTVFPAAILHRVSPLS